jgi:hypothetical protein
MPIKAILLPKTQETPGSFSLFHQSDNVLNNQSRNVLREGYNYFLIGGGNYGWKGHDHNEFRRGKATEVDPVSNGQTNHPEDSILDVRDK